MSPYEALLVRASLVWLVLTGALGVLFYLAPTMAGLFRTTHVRVACCSSPPSSCSPWR